MEVKTPGFTVYGDDGEKGARRVAGRLEDMRAFLQAEWPWARFTPEVPVIVLALRDRARLRLLLPSEYRSVEVGGITLVEPDRTLVLLQRDVPDDPTEENPYHVVYHEYVHGVLGRTLALPAWLSEGLAEFWGSTKITQREIEFGRPIGMHVLRLRSKPALPLETLFRVDRSSPHYGEQDRATIFYAESWALVHYLALGAPDRKGQLNRLVGRLAEGGDALVAAREVLGDLEALGRELAEYVKRSSFKFRRRPRHWAGDESPGEARRLSRAEILSLRGGVLLSVRRAGEGKLLLEEALRLDPGLATATEAFGTAAFRAGQDDMARQWLTRATDGGQAGFYAHYALGILAYRERTAIALARAESELREALRLNPEFAPALSALAGVVGRRGAPDGEALELLQRAIELDPNDAAVRLAAAGELLRLERPDEARGHAQAAARLSSNARTASQAAEILEAIEGTGATSRPDPRLAPPEAPGLEAPDADRLKGLDTRLTSLYEERCEEGEAAACLVLAERLEQGLGGLPVDEARAAAFRARACAAGLRPACAR